MPAISIKNNAKSSITAGEVDSGRSGPANQLREGRDFVQAGHPILEVLPEGETLFAAGLLEAGEGVAASAPVRAAGSGADVAVLHDVPQVGLAAVVVDRPVGALQHPQPFGLVALEPLQDLIERFAGRFRGAQRFEVRSDPVFGRRVGVTAINLT